MTFDLATGRDAFRVYEPSECGPDGYPRAWHDLGDGIGVKHLVREQAGHRCVRCGHPYRVGESPGEWSPCDEQCHHDGPCRWTHEGVAYPVAGPRELDELGLAWPSTLEAQWRILTVHHLTGSWGYEADAKRDCRWWNLVAVCQRCHLTLQRKVDMRRVYPWPHSEWFRPYAAGWYAHAYLGEDLTREETLARLDELLALEEAA